MLFQRRACSTGVVLASVLLGGCGATIYTPRPSPRIQVVPDGSQLVLVKNGHRYTTGALGGSVEEAVEDNPQAREEAREYRHRGIAGFILSTVGSVTAGVGAGVLIGNEFQQNPSDGLRDASIGMTIGGAVLSLVGSFIISSAQPHLWNAINIYNDSLPAPYPVWTPRPGYQGGGYPGYPAAPAYGPGAVPPPAAPGPPPGTPFPAAPLAPVAPAPLAPVAPVAPLAPPPAHGPPPG